MVIGKVMSVDYNKIRVKISSNVKGNSVNIRGEIYYFGNIGSYLKVNNTIKESIICEVVSIFDSEINNDLVSFNTESNRELLIKPIGTVNKNNIFNLGIGIYPGIYSDVSIVTYDDMEILLKTTNEVLLNNNIHQSFHLGISKNLINYPINMNIDNFFNIHSAILGNSGSGKSNTIAHIIQEIHKKKNYSAFGSKILIFDVNGEYKEAFQKSTNSKINYRYFKPNKLDHDDDEILPFYLPHFLLSLDEWSSFLLATDATQRPFWDNVLQESFRFYSIGNSNEDEQKQFENYFRYRICNLIFSALRQADSDTTRITTAASILGSISSIIKSDDKLEQASATLLTDIEDLQKSCIINYGENKNKLQNATEKIFEKVDVSDAEAIKKSKKCYGEFFDYKFLKISAELVLLEEDARGNKQIRGYTATMLTRLNYFLDNPDCKFMRESTQILKAEDYIKNIWGTDNDSQLTIIDTSELSPDILEIVTSVTTRILFDERKKLVGENRRKKPIHIVLDEAHRYINKSKNYILKENIFEKIAREGRKYSFYLLVSSQRPSELSETVLSQCANFIIHRIQNERDMQHIKAILPYFSDDFVNKIKQSTPGEALVFGNCVPMPLHLLIKLADPSPNSKNCNIPEEWFIE